MKCYRVRGRHGTVRLEELRLVGVALRGETKRSGQFRLGSLIVGA